MIRAGEIRKGMGQIQFSLTVLDTAQLRPRLSTSGDAPAPSVARSGIEFSASQVLVGFFSALGGVSMLVWAIIRLWLFE